MNQLLAKILEAHGGIDRWRGKPLFQYGRQIEIEACAAANPIPSFLFVGVREDRGE